MLSSNSSQATPSWRTLEDFEKKNLSLPSPIFQIPNMFNQQEVSISIKRDDLIHPQISGNKWRKLRGVVKAILENGINEVVSFGGAYSNHVHALAYVAKLLEIKATVYIRGEAHSPLNPTLQDVSNCGVKIEYLSRAAFRALRTQGVPDELKNRHPGALFVAEGGAGELSALGLRSLANEIPPDYSHIVLPVGTGATLAGLSSAISFPCKLLGISVVNAVQGLNNQLERQAVPSVSGVSWKLLDGFHFGGYAKTTTMLLDFCMQTKEVYQFQVEPIYSGKALYALEELIKSGEIPAGSRVLFIHTGGLQGDRA